MADGGKNIDTGTGGFELPNDDDLLTFDVGHDVPANTKKPYGKYEKGVKFDKDPLNPDDKKDLSDFTKKKLSDYLSGLTSAPSTGNEYPIDPGESTRGTSITDDKGYPALQSPGIADPSNSKEFQPDQTTLSALSAAFTTAVDPTSGALLLKGKGRSKAGGAVNGNKLLPGVVATAAYTATNPASVASSDDQLGMPVLGDPTKTPGGTPAVMTNIVTPYQSAVMSTNRFTASSTFAGAKAPSNAAGFNPSFPVQSTLGAYNPAASVLTSGQLANIGSVLSMRAAGELGATASDADPNSSALELAAILPGLAQLGLTQISQQTLLASDVLSLMDTSATDELTNSQFVLSTGTDSWGNMNDVDDPYSGVDAIGMVAMSFILVAGIDVLFQGLSLLLSQINSSVTFPGRDSIVRYNLGEYIAGTKSGNKASSGGIGGAVAALSSLNFGALLGIRPTIYPFATALQWGTNAFFQLPEPSANNVGLGAVAGAVTGAATSSCDSPGFNSVTARTIIRSGIIILNQLKKIGGSIMNAITQILALIDVIASSKLIAACNIFAMLGDAVLTDPTTWVDGSVGPGVKVSAMDANSDGSPWDTVTMNRLPTSLKLAWASNRAPANLLIPSSILSLSTVLSTSKNLGSWSPMMGIGGDRQSNISANVLPQLAGGRIDSATAALFECQLDASYVPFYFHDIRTNEMVAFHAFLASLTDDYTASYEKSEGFGRVEPVRIYKSTERKIGISFYVAATSLPDFDDMWVKLNKLVTLIYPQYTQGVQLTDASGKYVFTQPFSQLVGASPLIRIRLGDLIRSNYTPFALGRLFGLGNNSFAVGATAVEGAEGTFTATDIDTAIQAALSTGTPLEFYPTAGIYPYAPAPNATSGGLMGALANAAGSAAGFTATNQTPPTQATEFCSMDDTCFKVVASAAPVAGVVVGTVQLRDDPAFTNSHVATNKWYTAQYQKGDGTAGSDTTTAYIGGNYYFPLSMLKLTEESLQTVVNNVVSSKSPSTSASNSTFDNDLSTFLSSDNNAVVKSFADTGGKGLAGFIESMHFDWYDKVTWETQDGRTAPKICKVTLTFSPVHDISPGIDHFGYNRAPIYPVGSMGQSFAATPAAPKTATIGGPAQTGATNMGGSAPSPALKATSSGASSAATGLPTTTPGQ